MTARSPSAFMLSAALHALVAGLAILLSYTASRPDNDAAKVFELVAGEGDNFMATEAPALGTPGVKLNVRTPAPPKAEPTPPAAEPEPQPRPVEPPPVKAEPPPVTKAASPIPDFSKKIKREMIVAESRAKLQLKREREAEAKRKAAEAKKAAEDEKKRLSIEEFNRLNKSKSPPSSTKGKTTTVPKVAKIDAEGIAKGVTGGSTANKKGGAGGKALVATDGTELERYYALFKQRLKEKFEPPPGMSDTLIALVSVVNNPDGSLTNPRIIESSGSKEFDQAVLAAIRRTTMPARPDGKSEILRFPFTLRERDEP